MGVALGTRWLSTARKYGEQDQVQRKWYCWVYACSLRSTIYTLGLKGLPIYHGSRRLME